MIEDKSISELKDLQVEIRLSLTDQSFAADLNYWDTLLTKIKEKIGILEIESYLSEFDSKNQI